MNIAENLKNIKNVLPNHVTVVAVSKTKPVTAIQEAYNSGHRIFGENKIQEMTEKHAVLPKDIEWHMIGHVQRNKVKYMAPYVHMIHGVDSIKLLAEINKQALKNNRSIECLLQIKIADEDTKFGMLQEEAAALLHHDLLIDLKNIVIKGFMGMATFTDDTKQIKREFESLYSFFNTIKEQNISKENVQLDILSMGMSGDYQIAVDSGSNMVRIGSSIFGSRNYH